MTYHHLEPVIGLEIHVQLKTATKLFSSIDNHAEGAAANTLISAIDLGHPGTLPSLNREALRFAVRIGLALGCKINTPTYFDRKHYIYPDLPKGYQISQFDVPVAADGVITIDIPEGPRSKAVIHIERAHLEEDAAKNIHRDGKTLVDFNRAGTPLVEIVTCPDFKTPNEAKIFLLELRRILRYLAVSDADMEKGHMRCDANVSLRPVNAQGLPVADDYYPKTEVKNMNSFKSVERALVFEIDRQTTLWEAGTPPMVTTTRGWDNDHSKTVLQRTKEEAADYRFMREPDIPPTDLSLYIQEEMDTRPELPAQRRQRFQSEYALSEQAAATLTDDPALADFTERVISELFAWLAANPDIDATDENVVERYNQPVGKLVGTWIGTKLLGALAERSSDIRITQIEPENMAELLNLIYQKIVTAHQATQVLEKMLNDGDSPTHIIEALGLTTISDTDALSAIIDQVLAENPHQVEAYKAGKVVLLQFFIGMVQKITQGSANVPKTKELLESKLCD
ncbi:Asp-tRNA(Asn)/Glu-tRNA(Gln) amidotransferase GatCAB subunit B [Candidatus Uhrbacteria bacterium CG10_big_fil_rev_8_21_14_0_10_50_16]|uniref:Aspartyl/glutamyl-tRNA(Asn/Gln) amidotransferase subunit B n=1 Tax=Candidatus Uhrbacteria bacterium CG10_big_fil_rev_8_21_14_0_10_50_16 TaxID=1975039 RepID=A0A2H0RM99_9BACT|nr:MAG: Asp-tRNA(Asn)/Glu-tRNA(Gln) amidotransferase GatCAB subunit B [Candidatus Uhrbacteria bacterium CG10_big_fil_rev_8_21_14_0_10_50_16]